MANEVNVENFQEILKTNKVVVLDYWAPWCPPCRAFGPVFEDFYSQRHDIYAGKVNTDDNKSLREQEGIKNIPSVVFYVNGQPVKKNVGPMTLEELNEVVDSYLK